MAFTTDLTTDIGKVRLLIHDLDSTRPLFPDDTQIQVFIDIEIEVKPAAALALETIAANRALTMQVVQLLDLKLDGSKTAEGLIKAAKALRESYAEDWAGFDIAQMVDITPFAYNEYLSKLMEAE